MFVAIIVAGCIMLVAVCFRLVCLGGLVMVLVYMIDLVVLL